MKRYALNPKWVILAILFLGLALTIRPAWAGTRIFDPTVDTCTTNNCGAVTLNGTIFSFSPSADHFDVDLFANTSECLRVAVTSEFTDLETVVRAPNGTVYRNDDGGIAPCPLCPVVKVNSTPNNGWYSVTIGQFAGAPVTGNFTLSYGRYNAGNPNCAASTTPLAGNNPAAEAFQGKADNGQVPPAPGAPGGGK
jgi:hypothetical protein